MRKRFHVGSLLIIVLTLGVWVFSTRAQEDITHVEDSGFTDRMRPGVRFAHDDHNLAAEIEECNVCHHVYEDGKRIEDDTSEGDLCSECHFAEEDTGPQLPLIVAYHNQCKGCHQTRKAGPVMCAECHRKE